ncbi:type II toxin-antitoxin system RelE/ParE family toxin [Sphingomonas sp.]|jgi:plasmid stabilization system protein ParE|uniref:type II toxin-antitoxin system RelE/ParE family toxin n=1 Tax=Sphingomonas sp. TaxID=28214 RepID=UPI002DE828B1|nr:type II toxin-antitoxin system RelE/ParE family toxin [Sphingomonas sp.]
MRVEFSVQSRLDLEAAEDYWVPRDPSVYRDLTVSLEHTLLLLAESPSIGTPVGRSRQRKWRIGRTPFLLFYRHHGEVLRVARIRHEREDWRRSH